MRTRPTADDVDDRLGVDGHQEGGAAAAVAVAARLGEKRAEQGHIVGLLAAHIHTVCI